MDSQVSNVIFFVGCSTIVVVILIAFVINLLFVSRNRRLKHNAQVLEMQSTYDRDLMRTKIEVAENTLNEIARELHDDVGQMLSFSIIQLNTIKPNTLVDLNSQLEEVRESIRTSLQSVKSISKISSNEYLKAFGLYESLKRLFERIERQGLIKTKVHLPINNPFQSHSVELFTFRIIQELVNNSLNHADCSEICLTISESINYNKIEYEDNGKGFLMATPGPLFKPTGQGFTNIYKRVDLMGGKHQIKTEPGKGFKFQLLLQKT